MDRWSNLQFGPPLFQTVATWLMAAWALATFIDLFIDREWLTIAWWILSIVMLPAVIVGLAAPFVYRLAAKRS